MEDSLVLTVGITIVGSLAVALVFHPQDDLYAKYIIAKKCRKELNDWVDGYKAAKSGPTEGAPIGKSTNWFLDGVKEGQETKKFLMEFKS